MNEKILLQKLVEGDDLSFSKVFDLHWENLFTYVAKVLKDKDDSIDVVQDTFTALWEQRDQLAHVKSLKAYLFSIARYKAFRFIHLNLQKRDYFNSLASFLTATSIDLEEHVYARELSSFIENEMMKLPPKMREIFILSRIEQLSYKEIAERLSISDKTVKKQISNSIKYLRLRMDEQYLTSIFFLWWIYKQ